MRSAIGPRARGKENVMGGGSPGKHKRAYCEGERHKKGGTQ